MKISLNKAPRYAAFTLIEMIGVLAVIAILASLLIPKILNAINDSRINNTVLSYNTMKTAVMDHYGKYGSFTATTNGAAISAQSLTNYATPLLVEGLIDKPFFTKIGTNSFVQVLQSTSVPGYDLDGDGANDVSTANATVLVEAIISGVSYSDAKDVNDRLDGATGNFIFPASGTDDTKGRVQYLSAGGGTLRIYIGHR